MASRHRKLLDESLPEIIATFCEGNCAEPKKYNNTCPISCLSFCPDPYSCKLSIIPFPPPPPPLPPIVSPDAGADRRHGGLSVPLLAALAALAAAFFLFTCYTLFKFYRVWKSSRRRRRERRQPEEEEEDGGGDFLDEEAVDHPIWYIRTVGLPAAAISAITIVKYKGGDGVVDGSDCAVCLSEFQDDETLRLLPKCSHAFHIPCIDTWLASHTNCPMCRAGIMASAPGPAQEAPERHSGRVEEARPEAPGSGDDVEFEGDSAARARIGAEIDENDCKMRRSVSMDSVAASMISAAVASAFPRQKKAEDVGNRSSSSSMKRSASCSAKVFLSRHSSRR